MVFSGKSYMGGKEIFMMKLRFNIGAIIKLDVIGYSMSIVGKVLDVHPDEITLVLQKRVSAGAPLDYSIPNEDRLSADTDKVIHIDRDNRFIWRYALVSDIPIEDTILCLSKKELSNLILNQYSNSGRCFGTGKSCENM